MNCSPNYERLAESLQTSEEILFAIEQVTDSIFKRDENDEITENAAYGLWVGGGRENEILANLPTEHAEENELIYWGAANGVFAEFDGEKWNLK